MFRKYSKIHLEPPLTGGWPFIKDPIHGEITFEGHASWLYSLVNTPEFQRLGNISQLGFLKENFPSATHSRLSHSLGAYALSSKFINHFLSLGELSLDDDQLEIELCLCSALLHDLGHGPFSHFFERLLPSFSHEQMTGKLVLNKNSQLYSLLEKRSLFFGKGGEFFPREITKILLKESERDWIENLISSQIDVDRLDYLLRDKYFCGSSTLSVDPNLIIKWTRLLNIEGKKQLVFLEKTNYQRCSLLLSRDYMQKEIYGNLSACSYQILLIGIFFEWKKSFQDSFRENPFYSLLSPIFNDEEWDVTSFIELTDSSLLERINQLFLELEEKQDSKFKKLYSLLLLFKGYTEESEHILLRMKTKEFEDFQTFSEKEAKTGEIVLIKTVSSLIGEEIINRKQILKYLDIRTDKFREIELVLPKINEEEDYFLLISKSLNNKWIEFKCKLKKIGD